MKSNLRVDMHVHLGRSKDGAKYGPGDVRQLLERYSFSHAVLFPVDEREPGPSYSRLNARVAKTAKKDKRILGFVRLNPHEKEAAHRELTLAAKRGMRGVKLHPRAEDFSPHETEELFREIESHRFPVMLHTSHEPHCHPIAWEGIFLRHKKICFILAHAGKDAYREAASVAKRCPNVYLDTSTLSFRRTTVILKEVGAGKVVFASDAPYSHPAVELLKFDLILKGNSAACRKIFQENPKKILGGLV